MVKPRGGSLLTLPPGMFLYTYALILTHLQCIVGESPWHLLTVACDLLQGLQREESWVRHLSQTRTVLRESRQAGMTFDSSLLLRNTCTYVPKSREVDGPITPLQGQRMVSHTLNSISVALFISNG